MKNTFENTGRCWLLALVVAGGLLGPGPLAAQEAPSPAEGEVGDRLRWQLAAGDVLRYHEQVTTHSTLGETVLDGLIERWVRAEVLEVRPDGVAVVSFVREAAREAGHVTTGDGIDEDYSSDSRDGTVDARHLYELGMVGQELRAEMTSEGQILAVAAPDSLDHFFRRWTALLAQLDASGSMAGEERPEVPTDILDRALNPAFWQLRWPILTGDVPAVGGTWESAQDYPTFLRAEIRTQRTYTIESVEADGTTRVGFVGSRDLAHSIPGAEAYLQVDTFDTAGGLVFDARSGQLLSNTEQLAIQTRVSIPGEETREAASTMTFTRTRMD